jgi:hypothetical protein
MKTFEEAFEELNKLLDTPEQNWFFGAGVSANANVPLMIPLTNRVSKILSERGKGKYKQVFDAIRSALDGGAHVEHVLSHLGDLIALAQRSSSKSAHLKRKALSLDLLEKTYKEIIAAIAITIRCGYREGEGGSSNSCGTLEKPIVDVSDHLRFVDALLSSRANLEGRSRFTFFTTNYDTLLEDAMALRQRHVIDGFLGGSTGFWEPSCFSSEKDLSPRCHRIYKLHGSIDWLIDSERRLIRARFGPKYFDSNFGILIYPQATKYVETQKDPFAVLFQAFRRTLSSESSNVLVVSGYSFGDDHINSEIEVALSRQGSKCTLVTFSRELDGQNGADSKLCPVLERWRLSETFGKRIYVASNKALYANKGRFERNGGAPLDWWKFTDLSQFLLTRSV